MDTWRVPYSSRPAEYRLLLQGTDVTLGWDVPASQAGRWELELDELRESLDGQGMLRLGDVSSRAKGVLRQAGVLPAYVLLGLNYPNPFNPMTTISYRLTQEEYVVLSIWNLAGQYVRELVRTTQPAGHYSATWNGRDEAGSLVGSGVYLYQLRAGDLRVTRKMALMK